MAKTRIGKVRFETEKHKEDDRLHLLVLGAPRSGTTLLSSIVGFHPEVRMMVECGSHEHRQQIGGRVVGNKLCIPNHITLSPRPLSLPEYAEQFARWVLDRPSHPVTIRVYVEEWGGELIPIIRSPDHVVHSMCNRGGKSAAKARQQWAEATTTIHRVCEEYPERTHLVHFRNLVTSPEAEARALCNFMGLEYAPSMLSGPGGVPGSYDDNDEIDSSVATKSVPESNMEQRHPEAMRQYEELVVRAERGEGAGTVED